MDAATAKQLVDRIYEKRKAAALELEKQVRECHMNGDERRINTIIEQLIEMFSNSSNAMHIRNGGLIGLAGTAIALGVDVAPYMSKFISPLLLCFTDPENRIRYFSAECLYNIAKVSKGEVLVFFNDIFDALSKLAADSELSVKNGAELLDRLLKDIVAESASIYVPSYPETERIRNSFPGVLIPVYGEMGEPEGSAKKAFSLAHFIPLLRERIYVVSPFTRSYLVSWLTVLDSVPELELITYLPEFLDGLLKYLSDPIEDVRVATETLLGDFLREIHNVAIVKKRMEDDVKSKASEAEDSVKRSENGESLEPTVFADDHKTLAGEHDDEISTNIDEKDAGVWVPGQGVKIDYASIVEILLQQLDGEHDEIQQSTALIWLAEFLHFVPDQMVPFTPRLIPAMLPNLAHHVNMIQTAAVRTNGRLFHVIQNLPSPHDNASRPAPEKPSPNPRNIASPTPTTASASKPQQSRESIPEAESPTMPNAPLQRSKNSSADISRTVIPNDGQQAGSRPVSPDPEQTPVVDLPPEDVDPFDYQATVNELTIQFLSEYEETRVAALKWLIMLHQKAPKKILAMDDGTFPALLKTLSDSSEEVIKHDLQLLAQISSSSEESYFKAFMVNLLELFSTDRRLLETRGSLIIRQLCLNLNTEKIYRTFAEILEKEDDLEFASVMVQKLNLILITSPELADFRRRLKNLETRQDGQALFTTLYRSWCHNAVAVFSLCLIAQAYEHASNLLTIFADLEVTIAMLVQIDKLVQLLESPIFTYLRLQLLEPERNPHLFKCLYGLLMLLPQSSAFVSLRNRLNAVNSAGFLHIAPKPPVNTLSSRSKFARDEIKWQELLQHFRSVQAKHEKARRQAVGGDLASLPDWTDGDKGDSGSSSINGDRIPRATTPSSLVSKSRPALARKATNDQVMGSNAPPRTGALSPLNPRARLTNSQVGPTPFTGVSQNKARRVDLTKKAVS